MDTPAARLTASVRSPSDGSSPLRGLAMAARAGLDRDAVVAAAIEIVDAEGMKALSLARLAQELGVRTPSLYSHVDGQRGLRRALWIATVDELGDVLRTSVLGRSGDDA